MNVIISIYIFICIMMLLFDIAYLIVKNARVKGIGTGLNKLRVSLKAELDNYKPALGLSRKLKKFLVKDISKTKNLLVLQNQLEIITENIDEFKTEIRPHILNQIEVYQKKSDYEQAYYAYVVSFYDYENEKLDERFYTQFSVFLESKSLYVLSNAVKAAYKFSDPYYMLVVIQKLDQRAGFYHGKLFVDGLLEFKGNIDILHDLILDKFYQYSPLTQSNLLNYFRLKGTDIEDFCLDILKARKVDNSVIYEAMRYFVKYHNEEIKRMFLSILLDEDSFWVEQMIAIQGLNRYDDPLVKEIIKEKITSTNWYIRTNALSYLHYHNLAPEEITEILFLKDKYTNESLLYLYKDDQQATEYIEGIIESINAERNILEKLKAPTV